MKVNLIYNRMPHHAARSGYDQIARYLADRVPVERFEGDIPKIIPWRVWEWFTERSGEWIANRSGMDWYDPYSLTLEARVACRLLLSNAEIYHILYGEDTYCYLSAFNGIAHRKGNRLIATYHQPPHIFDKVVRCKDVLNKLDAIIAVASNQAGYFASFVGKEKVFIVPHGVDTEYFHPLEHKSSDGKMCLFVGQWLRDFSMLEAVIRRVRARDPNVKFKIITRKDDGAISGGLNNVIALEWLSDTDLVKAYQCADILVMPLIDCTANNVLLEGLSCGIPIVTTDVGGIRDYVDSACAFVVPPGDVEAMCDVIITLASNECLRVIMGRQSRIRALTFDWRNVVNKLIDVYHVLTG